MQYARLFRRMAWVPIAIEWVLTLAVIIMLVLLSFSGAYLLLPSLPFAVASAVFAVLIEGEVYKQNIHSAFQRLKKFLNKDSGSKQKISHYFSGLFGIVAGIPAGAVTYCGLMSVGMTVSSLTLLSSSTPLLIVCAVLAGLGNAFIIYHTLRMIGEEQFFLAKSTQTSAPNNALHKIKQLVLGFAFLGILGLACFTSYAMASTWWMSLIPLWSLSGITSVLTLTLPCYVLAQFLFNVLNAWQTVKLMSHIHFECVDFKAIFFYQINGGWAHFNPIYALLKLIELPSVLVIFLLHMVSMGVSINRAQGVSADSATILTSLFDGIVDSHYFMPHQGFSNCVNEDHSHLMIGVLVKLILTVVGLYPISIVWQCISEGTGFDFEKIQSIIEKHYVSSKAQDIYSEMSDAKKGSVAAEKELIKDSRAQSNQNNLFSSRSVIDAPSKNSQRNICIIL